MNINKIKAYLGFAIKSGNIIFGYDNIITTKKKLKLIIVSNTVNNKISTKINDFADSKKIKLINLSELSVEELISRDNCKLIGIVDENLASAIIKEMEC